MSSVAKYLAAIGAAFVLTAVSTTPAHAEGATTSGPVKLSDHELAQVEGGAGSLLDLNVMLNVMLKNIAVTVNVSNVPINAGVAVQANALGTAAQTATVQALQSVT